MSSFSNQDDGGVIIFGVDEDHDYREVGVYDAQDLQRSVNAQCLQMEPVVRPLMTVMERDGKSFVAAEIPGIDLSERPCYYRGQGRIKGSFVRIGDSDEPMTEYEIYSYESFRKKYQDDIRPIQRATLQALDREELEIYVQKLKDGKPNLARLSDPEIYELMNITRNECVTLSAVMLFSPYPQAYFPSDVHHCGCGSWHRGWRRRRHGRRFIDNQRIEGNIAQMLDEALQFVRKNMRNKTIIDPDTGKRDDRTDYPITAVREAVVNALVHRDYSIHTEGMPIQLLMFSDRLEIRNPGGIYGRLRVDQLGKVQPDTRNPVLASAMEVLGITENRYSGIPTIRKVMAEYGLREPEFLDQRGSFVVKFYAGVKEVCKTEHDEKVEDLLLFCQTPRTRREIADYLGLTSVTYAIQRHIMPLVEQGLIRMSVPDKPKSQKQRYQTVRR